MKFESLFIEKEISVKEAIKKLDDTAKKILLVIEAGKLAGIVTDGDIRRWILGNGDLSEKIEMVMNNNPKFVFEGDQQGALTLMKKHLIEAVPVLNDMEEVVDVMFWTDNFENVINHFEKLTNPVVIMAGGKGTRLDPFTKILPKPLIPIGDIPIVERIINRFHEYGCSNFYMTVNYKKNMIKAYFNEVEKEYSLDYVEEIKPTGTAGSLSMLKDKLTETFFVSNCDILIEGNYSNMMKFHKEKGNKITLVSSLKHFTIPYGVIEIDENGRVDKLFEKPEYDFLVNTGMYILEPEVLEDIPEDKFYHITELIEAYMKKGEKIGVYPVSDKSWLDMGQLKEMELMLERLGVK